MHRPRRRTGSVKPGDLATSLAAAIRQHPEASAVAVEARLAVCRACEHYEGNVCWRYCHGCGGTWMKWINRVILGGCDRWPT